VDNVRETKAAGADFCFFHGTDSNVKYFYKTTQSKF